MNSKQIRNDQKKVPQQGACCSEAFERHSLAVLEMRGLCSIESVLQSLYFRVCSDVHEKGSRKGFTRTILDKRRLLNDTPA